jgi:hypothetical protein
MPINRALSAEWKKAGYKPGMASAWVTRPPPDDLIRVYHFSSEVFAIDDIKHGRLKISRFSDMNDPFELLALAFDDSHSRTAVRQFKEDFDLKTGLLCFSANWNSPPLWSHYADRHRGICLGFDIPRDSALFVSYSERRLQAQTKRISQRNDIDDALQQLLLRTKFNDWNYEREIRVKIPLNKSIADNGMFFWPFGNDLRLVEVVIGPLSNANLFATRADVKAKYPDAKTFKARLAFKSFGIVPDERTVP